MTDKDKIRFLVTEHGHLTEEGIAFYTEFLVRKALQKVPEEILAHVAECTDCKQQCLELSEILVLSEQDNSESAREEHQQPPGDEKMKSTRTPLPGRHRGFYLQALGMAAGLALLIGIGWIITNRMRDMKDENVKVAGTAGHGDSSTRAGMAPGIQLWIDRWTEANPSAEASFRVNDGLETALRMLFRSTDFQMNTPDTIAEVRFGTALHFEWTDKKGKTLTLKIMDNQGRILHQRRLEHHVGYEVRKVLEPGLYYWFIEQSNYAVAGGRIGVTVDQ